ncbi:hypothetical protein HAX54_022759 [Datura stramonium]|uniref:U1-type domain-containing protein n=1 Tax=Datura stramonium TaxID=4076 RepID=A0ABS8S4A6_DATST|nr:hypothetical protein [Datura stramonium]
MAEDEGLENANAIQRELQYKQKIANLFSDDVFPLEVHVKRWKALISKRNRSTDGIIDCSQTTTTNCKYANVPQGTFESDEEINARGTISRSTSNVRRQKALISKNKKSVGKLIDCSPTTCIYTGVSLMEFDGGSTIFKSNSDINAESPSPDPLNKQPSPNPPSASSGTTIGESRAATSLSVMPKHDESITFQAPNTVMTTWPPHPSLSPAFTYSLRKKNAESSGPGCMSPQQHYTSNIMHYCEICGVHCSGALCFELHLRGQKHKDETLLEMHLKGQKHKAKQHEMEHGEKIKDENRGQQQFWCELCQVPCMNEETFTLHRKGKKHRRRLYVLEEKKKVEAQRLCHA